MAATHQVVRLRIPFDGHSLPESSLTSPGGSAVGGFLGGYDVLVDFGAYEGRGICTEAELNQIMRLREAGVIVSVAFAERNPPTPTVQRRPLAWGVIFLIGPVLLLIAATLLFLRGF